MRFLDWANKCRTIRTKNAVTIASQYPVRHVQIVLRLYDSISQIITGFDVDCACVAYDGNQVYAAPRALAAFMTQCNRVDLSRRSPSYENRLSKYSRRGFEVHWPALDRGKIDPTIFERSFGRTLGLARLLVLEKLPKSSDRDEYVDKRRRERGRPVINRYLRNRKRLAGNIKDQPEEDVAEWVDDEDVSSYHTFTVPYGPKFHAKKIEKLLYNKDLLLNAEWNKPKDREVKLHRHPCFFGVVDEIIEDCCGYCPSPITEDEIKVYEEERKTYISGRLTFIRDDPGRQEIGSFNPITDQDWTEMAYVGNTERLCQAIVNGDLGHVQDWCEQEGVDVNRRDYTGRTPLHLAVQCSTLEVVQCLIDHGARIVARVVDGKTALHIAAARGQVDMIKALMQKSLANEEEEEDKKQKRRKISHSESTTAIGDDNEQGKTEDASSTEESDQGEDSVTEGSFIKVKSESQEQTESLPEDNADDPDIFDINALAWDYYCSPLHLAIINGHADVVRLLVSEYGADVLLPVKILNQADRSPVGAILTLALTLSLPVDQAKEVARVLLELGATSLQADMKYYTALHHIVLGKNVDLLKLLFEIDEPAAKIAINHVGKTHNKASTPLTTAILGGDEVLVAELLRLGARPEITYESWIKTFVIKNAWIQSKSYEQNMTNFKNQVDQPLILAIVHEHPEMAKMLLQAGADANSVEKHAQANLSTSNANTNWYTTENALDVVRKKLENLKNWTPSAPSAKRHGLFGLPITQEPEVLKEENFYLAKYVEGTYAHWAARSGYRQQKAQNDEARKIYREYLKAKEEPQPGEREKREAIDKLIEEFEELEKMLLDRGARTFKEQYPDSYAEFVQNRQSRFLGSATTKPWDFNLTWGIPDMTPEKQIGYEKLFEAVWSDDLETVKQMTLGSWGETEPKQLPLSIAAKDINDMYPFQLACLRGNYGLAAQILNIALAQYQPDDDAGTRVRWNISTGESDNEDDVNIYSELIDERFTVDNIGALSDVVKSNVKPELMTTSAALLWRFTDDPAKYGSRCSLLRYALQTDDIKLFKFVLERGIEQAALLKKIDKDSSYQVERDLIDRAISLGRTAMISELISKTGDGIPLDDLAKESGVEIHENPKYYQGLNVRGRKREDWAEASRGGPGITAKENNPLLLEAARYGNIDSVDYFLSDTPLRKYREWAEANKDDIRVKKLQQSEKGFDQAVSSWLDTRSKFYIDVQDLPLIQDRRASTPLCDYTPPIRRAGYGADQASLGYHADNIESEILNRRTFTSSCRNNPRPSLHCLVSHLPRCFSTGTR
jgi:ankyrin repeat protein